MKWLNIISSLVKSQFAPLATQGEAPPPEAGSLTLAQIRSSLSTLASAGIDHVVALAALFKVELDEAIVRIQYKILCLGIAIGFSLVAYLLLVATAIEALHCWAELSYLASLSIILAVHAIIAVVALSIARRVQVGPVGTLVAEEIKTDLECIKLSIRESGKS